MIGFEIKNINPKNKKTNDCVIRAIALASGKEYMEVYKELFEISIKTGYMINDKRNYEKLLSSYGFIKYKQPRKPDNKKYLIGEIDEIIKPDDIVVVSCANHLTVVVANTLFDLWDCRRKTISNYFVKS